MQCGQFDWNEECEGGDCYKILEYHRDKFCNYKTTWRQVLAPRALDTPRA
jgi:hypothetical protein